MFTKRKVPDRKIRMLYICLLLGFAFALAGCSPAEDAITEVADCPDPEECPDCEECETCEVCPEPVVEESPLTALSDHEDIMALWSDSMHGNTWAEGKGPNTYCSRCHSPQNWDPASYVASDAETCVTCKFPFDEELRIAETMEFVAEEDWINITCSQCHYVEGDMIDATGVAWLDNASGEYVELSSSIELCEMCHVQSSGMIPGHEDATSGGTDHSIDLRGSAHTNWAQNAGDGRPDVCVDCHNPHSQAPVSCEDCHSGVADSSTHIHGLNAIHLDKVSCMACHDASGADVGPHPDEEMGGVFTPIVTEMGRGGPTTTAIISHSVQWSVACDRCHFEDNTWELMVLTEDGEVPEVEEEGGP